MADFDWEPFAGDRWTPTELGEELVGTITLIRTEKGQRGDVPVLTVEPKDGGAEKEVWCTVDLVQKLAAMNPQAGDMIAMKLVEFKNTGQPKPMKVFAVKHKAAENGAEPEPDEFSDEPF